MKPLSFLAILVAICFLVSCNSSADKPGTDTADDPAEDTIRVWKDDDTRTLTGYFSKRGLIKHTESATNGYILFTPSASTSTYLMNKKGEIVHTWKGDLNSMHAYLRENGNLVRVERDPDFPVFAAGGQSGRIREYTWEGEMIWDFEYATDKFLTHHDIALMPNGNVLAIAYEVKSVKEAIAAGRDPDHIPPAGLWPDKIIEIKPVLPTGGEIVWSWHMWDHLIQDKFPDKANYGQLSDNPGKININVYDDHAGPPMTPDMVENMKKAGVMTSNASVDNMGSDFTHTNSIFYNEKLDQIALSVPGYGEIFVIDHSTTTEEAKSSEGGRWGRGGDLLYRWGNPANYGRGSKQDQVLFFQHDARWIPEGYPHEGSLMVFNNDIPDPDNKAPSAFVAVLQARHPDPQISIGDIGNYSAVHIIKPPVDDKGAYILPEDKPFGPEDPDWTYTAPDKYSFYSNFVSGASMLKNGNLLVTEGAKGRFFEVDPDGKIVWEYWNPYYDNYKLPDGSNAQPIGPFIFGQFRITQFDPGYPAFKGKDLAVIDPQPKVYIPEPLPEGPPGGGGSGDGNPPDGLQKEKGK